MIRRPPRSTQSRSSAASDVYKRQLEELDEHAIATSVVAVPGSADEQEISTVARHTALWVHRPLSDAHNPAPVIDVLKTLDWTPSTYIWIAADAAVARAVKMYVLEERGHSQDWIKSSGYWVKGSPGASAKDLG